LSAGHGDPGFCGRWTLEVFNPWPVSVFIPVGARVVSMHVDRVYGHDTLYTARYNTTPDTWQPTDMLPRLGNI
jgi:deoxycytidine triphosphate deaminase